MKSQRNGGPDTSEKREHFAVIRREVVLHRMVMAECPDDRLFWGIVLWSWTGPEKSEAGAVVLKNAKGFIQRDASGKPIPAKLKDLRELMGWPEGMKGEVSRMIQRLISKNCVRFDKKTGILYAVEEPSPQETPKAVAGTRNWTIGRMVVDTRNLPTEPGARERAIQWLDATHDAWNQQLRELRTRYRELLVQAAPDLGIIIVFKEKNSRGESSSSSLSVNGATTTTPTEEPPPTEDFHEQHVATWEAAGKDGVPTPKQSAQTAAALDNRQQEFLRWLTPQKLKRVQHPGALQKLVAEFLQIKSSPPEPVPKCWKCGGSLENGSVNGACFGCALVSQTAGGQP